MERSAIGLPYDDMTVIDVSEQDFQTEVIERSRSVPVVVDFWAAWCGPCRQLTPALEQAAAAREGKVVLAKVDTDANPDISRSFGIQGIPAVKAFRDGEVTAEFVGAQPPAAVERFFDALVPSEADALVEAGDEASLRRALELEPNRADAALPLARMLHGRGDSEEALALAGNLPGNFGAEGLTARIGLEAEEDPQLAEAFAALDAGDTEKGLDLLLGALAETQDAERREALRRVIVAELDRLGVEHPLARDARRRLATALY
jgi:putative thioredoxin